MKNSWKIVFLVALSSINLLSGPSIAIGDEGGESVIGSIQTAGNRNISSGEILSKVRSRAGELFDSEGAAEDAKRITELNGVEYSYYNIAMVEGKVELTFVVVEKDVVRLIDFVGNRKYKDKTLQKQIGFKVGDYLDSVLAESGKEAIHKFYKKKGYAFTQAVLDSEQLSQGRVIYTLEEGPRVKIKAVKFEGNSALKTKALKKAIKTKKKTMFFWQSYYTEEKVAKDVTKLQNIYQKRGFLDASVIEKPTFSAGRSKAYITFEIKEGPVYTVDKIFVMGNKYFDSKRLEAELKLKEGGVYSDIQANSDAEQMLKLYQENGFIDADVKESRKFVSGNKVDVEFEIKEGDRFRIGQINITGNKETQDKVIRRILDEREFQPGQWYNADIARGNGTGELEKLIQRTALTESASITPSGDQPDRKDAQVSVVEGQTGSVMVGAGVASDSGVIGQVVFEQRNFDISDKPESFYELISGRAFKGAGQNLRIALQPGTEVSEYSISFSEPYFKDKPITLDVAGSSYERGRESYDEQRTKGYVGFEKRYKNKWRKSIGFRLENVNVDSIDADAPKEIEDIKGGNALAGVKLGVGRDLTDDRFNPSAGYSFSTNYEQVGGDYTFGVLSGNHRFYKTVYRDLAERKTILATKLHAATVLGDAPAFEKFYAGGQGSIRGFDYRGVSTRGLPTLPSTSTKRKDPIGSDWIFLANTELLTPLVSETVSALFFVDSGVIDSGNYRAAIGTGIQIMLPQWFGPVPMRFEIAAPIMKDDEDDTQIFSFSVGRFF